MLHPSNVPSMLPKNSRTLFVCVCVDYRTFSAFMQVFLRLFSQWWNGEVTEVASWRPFAFFQALGLVGNIGGKWMLGLDFEFFFNLNDIMILWLFLIQILCGIVLVMAALGTPSLLCSCHHWAASSGVPFYHAASDLLSSFFPKWTSICCSLRELTVLLAITQVLKHHLLKWS